MIAPVRVGERAAGKRDHERHAVRLLDDPRRTGRRWSSTSLDEAERPHGHHRANESYPADIVADPVAHFVYWSGGPQADRISRVATVGIPFVQVVVQGDANIRSLTLDQSAIYWISGFGARNPPPADALTVFSRTSRASRVECVFRPTRAFVPRRRFRPVSLGVPDRHVLAAT